MISSVSLKKGGGSKRDPKPKKASSSKRAQKRKLKQDAQDTEEHELESLLFGGSIGNYERSFQEADIMEGSTTGSYDVARDQEISRSDDEQDDDEEHLVDEQDFDEHGIMIDRSSSFRSTKLFNNDKETAFEVNNKKETTKINVITADDKGLVEATTTAKPVWVDSEEEGEDDENASKQKVSLVSTQKLKKLRSSLDQTSVDTKEYVQRLRERHEYSTSVPTSWAKVEDFHLREHIREGINDDEIDKAMSTSAHQLLSNSAAPLTSHDINGIPSSSALVAQSIRLERQPDANLMEPNKAAVQVVKFHPRHSKVLFTAGLDKTLRFFQIDGKTNPKVHGIHFPDMPIMSASYLGPEGSAVVLSGRRSYFYVCDVASGNVTKIPRIMHRPEKSLERMITSPCGKYIVFIGYDGHAILVDGSTRHLASTIKMNGSCRAVSFSPCGTYLFSSGSDGDVYQWDIRKTSSSIPKCVRRISNEDGTIVQSLALSDQFLAVGAESGVVNMFPSPCASDPDFSFNESYFSSSSTKQVAPLKRLMNLHTCATGLKFNHDGQILAMWSRFVNGVGSLKLVHSQSQTVFSNWPTNKTPLGYVWSLDFSPNSEYLAIGNDKGKCLLYSLRHYAD
mmetsp:Transcript_11892/g.17160  ORF Transcript_11892/g.17160 Transcript_11892/m.17160 type:complete len:621 (-) Transcript_11892:2527-4389(-)